MKEAERGRATQPVPATAAILESIPLPPILSILGEHGERARKIRVIDDFRASRVNDLLSTHDTGIPQNTDVFLGMTMVVGHHECAQPLKSCVADFAHAYKHIGVPSHQLDFASILLCGPNGNSRVATMKTHPFGSSRAPANWARLTSLVQFVLGKLFNVWMGIYVDDCFCVVPDAAVQSAIHPVRAFCSLIGLELERSKQQLPSNSADLL